MYRVRVSCVLLALLGTVDILGVNCATQSTSPSQGATTVTTNSGSIDAAEESNREQDKRYHQQPPPPQNGYYPPQNSQQYPPLYPPAIPPLILQDQYNRRYPDGSYEYRYALPDETVRYERGYIIPYLNTRILVVKGYYSYKLPDGRYHTVFYTADQYGFRQDSSTFSFHRPQLPRSWSEGSANEEELRDYDAPTTAPIGDELNSE